MSDDYLWDGTGEPDADVQRLERLLGPLRHQARPLRLPARRPTVWLAAAAALVLAAGAAWWSRTPRPAWEVARLAGAPHIDARPIADVGRWHVGDWLETDSGSRARIRVGEIGQVEVEPNTRLRRLQARPAEHRLALARGTLNAVITAPPRLFFVETPSAVAVDLGCAYSLSVDEGGAGLLRVAFGFVSLERGGRDTFVPAGAACALQPGRGPGTPYFEDALPALRAALARLDHGERAALESVLAGSRARDTLTLWSLLPRVDAAERAQVYERLAALAVPPAGVARERVLAADAAALLAWRRALEPAWLGAADQLPPKLLRKVKP
jgi:hypothetical protein